MSKLSFYEGATELSFATETSHFKFPYAYFPNVFVNSFSKEDFYRDVFSLACSSLGVELAQIELHSIGLYGNPQIPFETATSISLFDSMPSDHVIVNQDCVAANGEINSYMSVEVLESDNDFLANTELFPNLAFVDTRDINTRDTSLRQIIAQTQLHFSSGSIVMTGERFNNFDLNPPLSYLMVFDLIRDPGLYYTKIDKSNYAPHTLVHAQAATNFTVMGTLINSPGDTECLYRTDLGTSQLVEVPRDSLFILPLERGGEASLMVKNPQQNYERAVYGGELGVVIDTRDKVNQTEFKEIGLDVIIQAFNRI